MITYFQMVSQESLESKETTKSIDPLLELSHLLCTGLDAETLIICINLLKAGISPEYLATMVTELRKETLENQDSSKPCMISSESMSL